MSILGIHWRAMTSLDLPLVADIAAEVHPGFFERPAVFAERQQLHPDGTRLLEMHGEASGYVLSHPWEHGAPPALDVLLGALPAAPSTFYIHDLALLPAARGTGAAGTVIAALTAHAERLGLASMSLVAVNASQRFWERHGFAVADRPELADKLASYEESARFMVKPLV